MGIIFIIIILSCFFPQISFAVMPPDFIFNIGAQVAQFLSIITLFTSIAFGFVYQFFKSRFGLLERRKLLVVGITSVLLISGIVTYVYSMDKQQKEYERWLEESRIHSQPIQVNDKQEKEAVETGPIQEIEDSFYNLNKDVAISINDSDFMQVVMSNRVDYVILDAREDIEYTNGHYPDSLHIRFADLRNGQWQKLPKDKYIYVICWSGIRGKEVAEFLREKELAAIYLEGGALSWFDYGGKWIGNVKFADKYSESRYHIVFTTEEVRNMVAQGVLLIDTREPEKFKASHISNSINIPTMYTPSDEIEKTFGQLPSGSKFITVCDGYVNCFDAKVTGVELERRGHEFLGRYNKPWEYAK
ncbi:MAG: molybdopterin biosynthesis protein MoeB [Parcubacteria group bacterium ADurb.Bin216]|nr:MAG: molybdopterin biosynthesis protein MoeB [Parcubacteria group bacterium ADurb.Bin216]